MVLTIDTSVLLAVLLEEPTKKRLVALTQGADLQAPPSLHWELGNVLSALMRRKRITSVQAKQVLAVYESIPIRFAEILLADVIDIVGRHSIWAYDAYVIDCARRYRTPMLSLDKDQCRIAELEGVQVIKVAK